MTRRRRAGIAVLSFAAAAAITAGCNGDDDVADTTVAAPTTEATTTTMEATTTVAETTTTTSATTTTTTTTLPATTTDTTTSASTSTSVDQIDWIPVVEEVYARKFALLATPDPSRVAEVAVDGNPAYQQLLQNVTEMSVNGWHEERVPFTAARVDLVGQDDPGNDGPQTAMLVVWVNPGSGKGTVDSNGTVVIPYQPPPTPPGTLARYSVTLHRSSPVEPWRLVDETVLEPAAP